MYEFKHGMIVKDGFVMFRRVDFWAMRGANKPNTTVTEAIENAMLSHEGLVTAKDAKERLLSFKEELTSTLSEYEELIESLQEVTPEWLDEHLGK